MLTIRRLGRLDGDHLPPHKPHRRAWVLTIRALLCLCHICAPPASGSGQGQTARCRAWRAAQGARNTGRACSRAIGRELGGCKPSLVNKGEEGGNGGAVNSSAAWVGKEAPSSFVPLLCHYESTGSCGGAAGGRVMGWCSGTAGGWLAISAKRRRSSGGAGLSRSCSPQPAAVEASQVVA
jgi:hypothetical protein